MAYEVDRIAAGVSLLVLMSCSTPPGDLPAAPAGLVSPQSPSAPQTTPLPRPAMEAPIMAEVAGGSLRDFQQNVGDRIYFDYDRSELNPAAQEVVRRQAAWLHSHPSVTLMIEGHCDERGTREYNIALGARRASAVMSYLVTMGVSAARLETVSYGKERPSCTEASEWCWQQNRSSVSIIKSGATAGT